MKTGILEIIGGVILLASMVFAVARLGSADRWIHMWIPFVIVGVALSLAGFLVAHHRKA